MQHGLQITRVLDNAINARLDGPQRVRSHDELPPPLPALVQPGSAGQSDAEFPLTGDGAEAQLSGRPVDGPVLLVRRCRGQARRLEALRASRSDVYHLELRVARHADRVALVAGRVEVGCREGDVCFRKGWM